MYIYDRHINRYIDFSFIHNVYCSVICNKTMKPNLMFFSPKNHGLILVQVNLQKRLSYFRKTFTTKFQNPKIRYIV